MNEVRPEGGWVRDAARRLRSHAGLKFIGTTAFMSVFFVAYFQVLRNPIFAVREMPLTALDHAISFYPPALLAYVSLWFYVGIPPALLLSVRELLRYGIWIGALCCVGLLCFLVWPTEIPPLVLDLGQYPGFKILAGVDAKANACPSLHVATAVFSAIWLNRLLRDIQAPATLRIINWLWCLAITYSTLAIKQHVSLDALGGLALGIPVAFASLRRSAQAVPDSIGKLEFVPAAAPVRSEP
ncbi:MAG: phosphatase PAP2 family protein [Burkholderiaceae bacterium]